jgi:hypothetical protein
VGVSAQVVMFELVQVAGRLGVLLFKGHQLALAATI